MYYVDYFAITTQTNFAFYYRLTAFLKYPEHTLGQAYTKIGLSNICVCRLWRLKAIFFWSQSCSFINNLIVRTRQLVLKIYILQHDSDLQEKPC